MVLTFVLCAAPSSWAQVAQEEIVLTRPIPGPVVPPAFYLEAIENGARTADGRPGPNYWQVYSKYEIAAKLDPLTGIVSGRETVRFFNRSPDDLPYLMLHLHQNQHAEGVPRRGFSEITGGVRLHSVAADGEQLFVAGGRDEPGYLVMGSVMRIQLPTPVVAGGAVELQITWSFSVPRSAGRMGHSDREMYFIAYWFPKIGVYDDLRGWDVEPYLGSEFYDSFADYRVSIAVPTGWTVMATGRLENPEEVFSAQTLQRLAAARTADDVVKVASTEDRDEGRVTLNPDSGTLTYQFEATRVRDFTWTASDTQEWDATTATVADRDGDGIEDRVDINSFWRPERAPLWVDQVRYAKHSIEFLSRETGLAYPWPHMTSVEGDGIIGGGMEFPMLTLIGSYRERGEAIRLYGVTLHELAHMWTPMILGSNEKRHAWMDEGFATYLTAQGVPEYWPDADDTEASEANDYLETARAEGEGAMMRHGDYYEQGYGTASYAKPATMLVMLRKFLGDEVFEGALRAYFDEWMYKHPTPWDFFDTVERAAGTDLDWLWSSWYYETWHLDQAVAGVSQGSGGAVITIRDYGFIPMPAIVRIETSEAGTIERTVPVSHWLTGAKSYEIELPDSVGEVRSVSIDPEGLFPDVDRDNNVWPRQEETGG
jgi:hypothetical protein